MRTLLASVALAAIGMQSAAALELTPVGDYRTGIFDDGAAEIVDFHPASKRAYIVNGADKSIDMLDISRPNKPSLVKQISLEKYGKTANSVAVVGNLVVAAVENADKQANGSGEFFDIHGNHKASVELCALPDMVKATPDGRFVLFACEGEPNDAFDNDPEGMIAIVEITDGSINKTPSFVDFDMLNQELVEGLHLASPASTPAQQAEPEYIAVSKDSKTAWVSLQEMNAIAIVDIEKGMLKAVKGMGFKDFSKHPIDASNKDKKINIRPWPVKGMYQPDSIYAININGKDWIVTANEGDARDYDGFSEETRVAKLTLDAKAFPNAAELQDPKNLGRLKVTKTRGDLDGDGDYDALYAYGGRSFSVLNEAGEIVWDSGSQIEQYLAKHHPDTFNSTNDENGSFDDRSDDKGAEPEGITAGYVNGKPYVFLGLERMGGIMVYDMSNPVKPVFVTYRNDRIESGDPKADTAGELAPEGLTFVTAEDSPNGKALLIVASEVSGSTMVYEVE